MDIGFRSFFGCSLRLCLLTLRVTSTQKGLAVAIQVTVLVKKFLISVAFLFVKQCVAFINPNIFISILLVHTSH